MEIPFERPYSTDLVHPLEEDAQRALQSSMLYDWLAQEGAGWKNRLANRSEALFWLFPVTKGTVPRIDALYSLARQRLGCHECYPLFLKWDYDICAEVTGSDSDSYIITLSGLDSLQDDEILALLGQALGRIKAGHVPHMELLDLLESGVENIPVFGNIISKQVWGSFARWLVASQFTIDRYALFACGSEKAVSTLIMKQCGWDEGDIPAALAQTVYPAEELGVYFIWLVKSLPSFGGIERIAELRQWVRSARFCETYPGFYYRLRLEGEASGEASEGDLSHLQLHRAAVAGDTTAMVKLADLYMRGGTLPQSGFMAAEMYRAAAYFGNAKAMYIFAACLEQGVGKYDASIAHIERLYAASLSRGFEQAQKKLGRLWHKAVKPEFLDLHGLCAEFADLYGCKAAGDQAGMVASGDPIDNETARVVRDAFWLDGDEQIYAWDIKDDSIGLGLYGTVIASTGIYGRLTQDALPFHVSWDMLSQHSVREQRLKDGRSYLISGTTPMCTVKEKVRGTIGELIIRLAAQLNFRR